MPALYSADFKEVRMIPGRYAQAASWSDLRGTERPDKPWLNGKPRCIFVGDMGDTFSRAVTDEYLTRELLGAMTSKQGQRHFWMLLTKRPKRLAELAKQWGGLPDNAMAMTTVTNQRTAVVRVPQLLQVPCKWRGLSVEPLLQQVRIELSGRCPQCGGGEGFEECQFCAREYGDTVTVDRIHWVICGGESGTKARPMHPNWPRHIRDDCDVYDVPFFFKQWGDWSPGADRNFHSEQSPLYCIKPSGELSWYAGDEDTCINCSTNYAEGDVAISRMGKKGAGRELDHRQWNGFPEIEA
jgi:protein gp37